MSALEVTASKLGNLEKSYFDLSVFQCICKTRVISILCTLLLMGRLYNKPCKQATNPVFSGCGNQSTMSLDDLAKTAQLEVEGWGATGT